MFLVPVCRRYVLKYQYFSETYHINVPAQIIFKYR